jgi:phage tail sheath gpL-like
MTIAVDGFPTTDKIPQVAFVAMSAQGVRGPGTDLRRTVIVGQGVTQPAAGGTQAAATPCPIYSAEDAGTKFGCGSPIHRMARAFLERYPGAPLYGCRAADPAGVMATATITVAGPATSSGMIRLWIGGDSVEVAIASGDIANTVAAALRAAVGPGAGGGATANDSPLPVYSSGATNAVILNAKFLGADGNDIAFAYEQEGAAGIVLTGGAGNLASGTLEAAWDLAYDAVLDVDPLRYTYILPSTCDVTVLTSGADSIKTRIGSIALPSGGGKRGHVVVGSTASETTAETLSSALETGLASDPSGPRMQAAWVKNHDIEPWVLAALVAGTRASKEAQSVKQNWTGFTGCVIPGIHMPLSTANYPTRAEINLALTGGVTPITFDAVARVAKVIRSITCKHSTGGVSDYRAIDTSTPAIVDYVTDDLEVFLADTYDGCGVVNDVAGEIPDNLPENAVSPRCVEKAVYGRLKMHEEDGIIEQVDAYESAIQFARNGTVTSRIDGEVPIVAIRPLNQLAGNVREVGASG